MNQRPARKTQFKPNRRRRLFKWLTIILIFLALGCTAGLLIPGLNRSRNASVKLSSPLKIVQKVVSNGSSSTDSNTQLQEAWKPTLQQADGTWPLPSTRTNQKDLHGIQRCKSFISHGQHSQGLNFGRSLDETGHIKQQRAGQCPGHD
jgi:hypothetical protein